MMSKKIQKEMEVKFTKKDIQNTLKELGDVERLGDYNEMKELMKKYDFSVTVADIDLLRKVVKTLDSEVKEITKEKLLQMKEEQDFEIFKEEMRLHKLYLEKDPSGVRAEIKGPILRGRALNGYNFYLAEISDTDFSDCGLTNADFGQAVLDDVNFTNANLAYANFGGASFYNVDFTNANLTYANLPKSPIYFSESNNKLTNSFKRRTGVCLNKPIIGWKKCYLRWDIIHRCSVSAPDYSNAVLVKLEIPRGAVVFSINDNKCRTNMAKVLDIVSLDGKKHYKLAYASYKLFKYRVGEEVFEPNFNCQYNVECAEGIHFFRNKIEAKRY